MSTNYTGDDTATQAPSALPAKSATPVFTLPADGDALNAASVAQALKASADGLDFTFDRVLVLDSANTVSGINSFTVRQNFDAGATFQAGNVEVGLAESGLKPISVLDPDVTEITGSREFENVMANGSKVASRRIMATLQTTDATVTTIYTLAIPTGRALAVKAMCVAMQTSVANMAVYEEVSGFRNNAGTVSAVTGSPTVTVTLEDDAAWGAMGWVISGTDSLLKVTGKAGTTINWRVTIDVTEIGT